LLPPTASVLLSGLKARHVTRSLSTLNSPNSFPVAASSSLTDSPHLPAAASTLPSGLNLTTDTSRSSCLMLTFSLPASASQTRIDPSAHAQATTLLSALYVREDT